MNLLSNLRIIGSLTHGYYIATDNNYNIKSKFKNTLSNTLISLLYCETWSCTQTALRKIYCKDIPAYIDEIKTDIDKLLDLLECTKESIQGLERLKLMYKDDGYVQTDEEFEMLINSYALLHIKKIEALLNDFCKSQQNRKKEIVITKPELIRQTGMSALTEAMSHIML